MVRTIVVPKNKNISIEIPESYIGKQIEVLFYATDELTDNVPNGAKMSSFRGKLNLTDEQYSDFQEFVSSDREGWTRDI